MNKKTIIKKKMNFFLEIMKKIRQKILFLSIILLIFLLWQMILIIYSLKEIFIGIDFNQMNINQNTNLTVIPRIIHQMWKNSNLSTYPIQHSHFQWKKFYPNYQIRLWTDQDLEELIQTNEYIYLKEIYQSFQYSIQRADLGRLIIIHSQGGIYADLDVFPNNKSIEYLLLSNRSLIIPRSFTGSTLINHFFIGEKSSKVLDYILHQIKKRRFYEKIYLSPYLEVFTQGSFFLTKTIRKYLHLSSSNQNDIWILSEKELDQYITHHIGRSWHLFDGFILNLIDAKPKLSFTIFVVFLLFTFFFFKYLKNRSIGQRAL